MQSDVCWFLAMYMQYDEFVLHVAVFGASYVVERGKRILDVDFSQPLIICDQGTKQKIGSSF